MKTDIDFSSREMFALRHIRNELMQSGKFPSVRTLMEKMGYRSPRSISVLLQQLAEKGVVIHREGRYILNENAEISSPNEDTVDIPLLGSASCGTPIFAEENIEAYYKISTRLARPTAKHFLLRALGDSMDQKDIHGGDLLLIRQQNTAENGDIVVALVDGEATIKEFQKKNNTIILYPRSSNPLHKPIILDENLQIQGVVVRSIPAF
ncbi:transcriptional repressor LexA [Candidatus Gracilibacteria bacterium]|nr:transcriptional repressor LexA [Candidatus Gracilibacteria bacterium]MCF7819172.1 transcriptional repressor LexA [Candidatus Gracilibacteria bacterium]